MTPGYSREDVAAVARGETTYWMIDAQRENAARAAQPVLPREPGITETWRNASAGKPIYFALEAFAPTVAELERMIAAYIARYPIDPWCTRFGDVTPCDGGFTARGSCLKEGEWEGRPSLVSLALEIEQRKQSKRIAQRDAA